MNPQLQLRDIHLPPEPSWWPPAPGWWLVALLLCVALAWTLRWTLRRLRARRRLASLLAEFDAAAALADPGARVAAISQLLRRAARLRDPAAAALSGAAWLRFLDDAGAHAAQGEASLASGSGRVLLDGPYTPLPDARAVDALVAPARARFRALVDTP